MAVVTKPCGRVFPCLRTGVYQRSIKNGWTFKSICNFVKTQICTAAISFTLFNTVRLPREAFRYGAVPYLVVYSLWMLVVGLPTVLLQLAMGQLSQQDPVGIWRAVPILRGVGYLRILTSYICCIYTMMLTALAAAYLIWIGKDGFPLKECTKIHITPRGYENKMNASECFQNSNVNLEGMRKVEIHGTVSSKGKHREKISKSKDLRGSTTSTNMHRVNAVETRRSATFLAPFMDHPQYLGIMSILIFILWFFVPILLFRLHKSLKPSFNFFVLIIVIIIAVLCAFLSDKDSLTSMFLSCEQWMPLSEPYIWQSALVQALLSTSIVGGYLISAGGTVYRQSDVRWTSTSIVISNLIAGWLWILFWESISDNDVKDKSFISVLVLIYQSSESLQRSKEWPLLQFGIVLISGLFTVLILLFPIYDKLHRSAGDHWRLLATILSAVGTGASVAVLITGLEIATVLDTLIVPVLAVFTTAVEVVGFVFIYGWCYLEVDIEFLTGNKLPFGWVFTWWLTPILLFSVTGWWLRSLLQVTWSQTQTLWPLLGVFVGIIVIMVIMAAIAVAKEEQFNFLSKVASAFRSSRLWGPEEPMARYIWMSQRYANETLSSVIGGAVDSSNYAQITFAKPIDKNNEITPIDYPKTYYVYTKNGSVNDETIYKDVGPILGNETLPRSKKKKKPAEKFRSPNVCIAKEDLGGATNCNCNRHFKLTVPDLRKSETTTSL